MPKKASLPADTEITFLLSERFGGQATSTWFRLMFFLWLLKDVFVGSEAVQS
jgi:hypothetical protein